MLHKFTNLLKICFLAALLIYGILGLSCNPVPPAAMPSSPPPEPPVVSPPAPATSLKIQFLGQSCFVITSTTGLKIITDPYTAGDRTYSAINETADIVTVSHEHSDHNDVAAVKGNPEVIKGTGKKNSKGISIEGIATWHDNAQGTQRGPNTLFCFSVDGIKFCHAGDLGHRLSAEQIAQVGEVDILFIPVGGFFTIDARVATDVCNDLKPRIIIPMHYKTPKSNPSLAVVDDFLKGKERVEQPATSILELKPNSLPSDTRIIVLQPAR
jgi:L-ascorbate metabolism protein UlaG (beta-lactamase superfamily)